VDERLQKALDFSKYRISLFNRKEDLKIRMNSMLTYAQNGGIFKITPEFITWIKLIIDSDKDRVVLIDSNGNPTEITDLNNFYKNITEKYWEAVNVYHAEYVKLKSARSVAHVYEFKDD